MSMFALLEADLDDLIVLKMECEIGPGRASLGSGALLSGAKAWARSPGSIAGPT